MEKNLREKYEIKLMEELNLKGVKKYYEFVKERKKVKCLKKILYKLKIKKSIIFCK